jgi:hypothetical protein
MNNSRQIAQFGDGLKPPAGNGGLADFDTTAPLTSFETFLSQFIGFITLIAGLVFIVMFINGALKWITAGDDSGKVQKARDLIMNAVIGLIVTVAGYAIIGLIGSIVGIDILNPAETVRGIFGITGN